MEKVIEEIRDGVLDGDADLVETKVQEALDGGMQPRTILDDGLVDAMGEVGCLFEEGEYFVPEMLVAARAMQAGLGLLRPHLIEEEIKPSGRVVIGTVQGDLHDIGKNLVGMMLEGAGFEILDLGVNVAPAQFVAAVAESEVDILAISALLTTTMPNMQRVLEDLKVAGIRDRVKVIVGGAPVTDDFAAQIGADGYARDASQAATLARQLVN